MPRHAGTAPPQSAHCPDARAPDARASRALRRDPGSGRRRGQLVEHSVRAGVVRLLLEQLPVRVHCVACSRSGRVHLRVPASGECLGLAEAQVTETPQGLGPQRRLCIRNQQETPRSCARPAPRRPGRLAGPHWNASLGKVGERAGLARLARSLGGGQRREQAGEHRDAQPRAQCAPPARHRRRARRARNCAWVA